MATQIVKKSTLTEIDYTASDQDIGNTTAGCPSSSTDGDKKEPIQKITKAYFTDEEGTVIDSLSFEKHIFLVVESENMSGEEIIVPLTNTDVPLKFNDTLIDDKTEVLKHTISGSKDQIKLVPHLLDAAPREMVVELDKETQEEPELLSGFWCDEQLAQTTVIPYTDNQLFLRLSFNDKAVGKHFKVTVFEHDNLWPDKVIESATWHSISSNEMFWKAAYEPTQFQKGGEGAQKLYAEVEIQGFEKSIVPASESDYLDVHIVRFIPNIMLNQNPSWSKGSYMMDKWMTGASNNNPAASPPEMNAITMDWILDIDRINNFYQEKIIDKNFHLNDSKVQDQIKREIAKMVNRNEVVLPTAIGASVPFGHFNQEAILEEDTWTTSLEKIYVKNVPLTGAYYYNYSSYASSYNYSSYLPMNNASDQLVNLDDFVAAMGRVSFRILFTGEITKTGADTYSIHVSRAGVYGRDSYDFNDDGSFMSQPLGYWNPKTDYGGFNIAKGYYVNNASFRAFREDHDMGQDFLIFTDVKTYDADLTFSANASEL